MSRVGSAPDLHLIGVQAPFSDKKRGGSRPNSGNNKGKKEGRSGFEYEFSVVETLPQKYDGHGWPIVQKNNKTYTPVVGRSRANSAGTVKSFHSDTLEPRTNKSALLRQRLIAIEKNQNKQQEIPPPAAKKPPNSRIISAKRRKPTKSEENSQRNDENSPQKAENLNFRRTSGDVYAFTGENENSPTQKPNSDALKLNLDVLGDDSPKKRIVEDSHRKNEILNDIFASKIPSKSSTPKKPPKSLENDENFGKNSPEHEKHAEFSDEEQKIDEKQAVFSDDEQKINERHKNLIKPVENHEDFNTNRKNQILDDVFASSKTKSMENSPKTSNSNKSSKISPMAKNSRKNSQISDAPLENHEKLKKFLVDSPKLQENTQIFDKNNEKPENSQEKGVENSDDEIPAAENQKISGKTENREKLKENGSKFPKLQENEQIFDKNSEKSENLQEKHGEHSGDEIPAAENKKIYGEPENSEKQEENEPQIKNNRQKFPNLQENMQIFDKNNEKSEKLQENHVENKKILEKAENSPPVTDLDDIFQQKPRRMASMSAKDEENSEKTLPHQRPPAHHRNSPPVPAPHSFRHFSAFSADNFGETDRSTHRPMAPDDFSGTPTSEIDEDLPMESPLPTPTPPLVQGNDSFRRRAKHFAKLTDSQNNLTPKLAAEEEKYKSIKDYLTKINSADEERRGEIENLVSNRSIQLSDSPTKINENPQQEKVVNDSLIALIREMIEEKRALTTLCAQLLQQMQITTTKLVEIETRQEKSLITLIERNNGVKIPTDDENDWKLKYEESATFHAQEMSILCRKHEEEIERLKAELAKIHTETTSARANFVETSKLQTENVENVTQKSVESTEIGVQTEQIFAVDSFGDDSDVEKVDDGVKNRLLNVSEEKTQLESLLGEKNTEIQRLKTELAQVVDEQAEFASQLSSKLTNRIEDLQSENSTLKKQLEELEKRCNELAASLNANLNKTEPADV